MGSLHFYIKVNSTCHWSTGEALVQRHRPWHAPLRQCTLVQPLTPQPMKQAKRIAALLLSLTALSTTWAQDAVTTAAAKEAGAVLTPSGLVYLSLKDGTGASPTASDKVKVHYRGTFPDGKEFDSSYKRNEAIEFPLSGVIKCWTEGVQRMKVGGKAKLTCPAAIAYGTRGAGGVIPPNATLLFEVELLAINGR
jgi:FKBP-type peptidyl-prolyl cis-trans isomerase FkpA